MNLLGRLQLWFNDQCDGTWEHGSGIKIETLDNPGWSVDISLEGTKYESLKMNPIKEDGGDSNWIICEIKGKKFIANGDPTKLDRIIKTFLDLVS